MNVILTDVVAPGARIDRPSESPSSDSLSNPAIGESAARVRRNHVLIRRFALLGAMIGGMLAVPAMAEVVLEPVVYDVDGVEMHGTLAYDSGVSEPRPGVLVVHEWWGHDDHARARAAALAEEGYVALALDMYGEGRTADHPQTASEFASEIRSNRDLMLRRFDGAHAWLGSHERVADQSLAALGYCFGGSVVLEAARAGRDLSVVASFHGGLGTQNPANAETLRAEVLVFNGAADPLVPAEQIAAFREEMDAAQATYTFVDYSGVRHSFTNPGADALAEKFGMPVGYDERAARTSWTHTLEALRVKAQTTE